jgi:hypothetical protein
LGGAGWSGVGEQGGGAGPTCAEWSKARVVEQGEAELGSRAARPQGAGEACPRRRHGRCGSPPAAELACAAKAHGGGGPSLARGPWRPTRGGPPAGGGARTGGDRRGRWQEPTGEERWQQRKEKGRSEKK